MIVKTKYNLYLESGPRKKKTMVHIIDLLGCIAQGRTTEAALEVTPESIRSYRRFLHKHNKNVTPEIDFRTEIAAHVMEGHWLGNGDPTPGFEPDFEPLTGADQKIYLQRLNWLQDDLLMLIRDLPGEKLVAEPPKGRTIEHILRHIAESHGVYLRYQVGKVEGLSAALRAVEHGGIETLPYNLANLFEICNARLEALTEEERRQFVPHGAVSWTARRMFRRMLEHSWEHLLEISRRI